MCVIAVSKKGIKQPSEKDLKKMWEHNSHGGGYMSVRNGRVEIHKGFLEWADFIRSVRMEKFTENDPVVYHFRISTQGGVNPEMTHPFPLTHKLKLMKALDVVCDIGVAHNGIIPMTTSKEEKEYSDTALFVSKYLPYLIRSVSDLQIPQIRSVIEELGSYSKFAFMDCNGNIYTVGRFYDHKGILLSNENHLIDWSKVKAYKSFYEEKGDMNNVYSYEW